MARSVLSGLLCVSVVFGQAMLASTVATGPLDDQSSTTSTKKQADNPKKPSKSKNPSATEKVKTEDRMSTRGLKPPPKDAESDKPAKPDSSPKQ